MYAGWHARGPPRPSLLGGGGHDPDRREVGAARRARDRLRQQAVRRDRAEHRRPARPAPRAAARARGRGRGGAAAPRRAPGGGGGVRRRQYCGPPPRYEYELTGAGHELRGGLTALRAWGDKWMV